MVYDEFDSFIEDQEEETEEEEEKPEDGEPKDDDGSLRVPQSLVLPIHQCPHVVRVSPRGVEPRFAL